jgi:YD repeat-containing protein
MSEFDPTTIPLGYTYDENGNLLTFRNSTGYWWERTYDAAGRVLTYRDSTGDWSEYTYDENGWIISYRKEHLTPWDINRRVIWHYN